MSTTPISRASSRRTSAAFLAVGIALAALGGCSKKSTPQACAAGEAACTCRVDGSCDGGLTCAAGTCTPCTAGKVACPCLSNGSCDDGLACGAGACRTCVAGANGCPCDAGACVTGLECQVGTCVPESCVAGTRDCRCAAAGACDDGLYCGSGVCRSCTNEVAGCPCDGGVCANLVCESATCRVARTCDACKPQQRCQAGTATSDATCLEACAPGFAWNAATRACDPVAGATCTPNASGSIVAACAAEHRPCVEDATRAYCGTCLDGFVEEGRTCRAVKTCDDQGCAANHLTCTAGAAHADAACGACVEGWGQSGSACVALACVDIASQCGAQHKGCVELSGGGAVCRGCVTGYVADAATGACRVPYTCATLPAPCAGGQVCTEGSATRDAVCRDASCPLCAGAGEDGIWPDRTADGKCLCKTLPGYFYSLSGSVGTFPCDADGDGWVRDTARFALQSADPAIRMNARCALRTVDRFVLHNDRGQAKTLTLAAPVPLYESVRNDDQARLDQAAGSSTVPLYGTERTLRAAELNSLTKACVGEQADFNDNRLNDVAEWGRPPLEQAPVAASGNLPVDLVQVYTRYSYFLELHRGWFEPSFAGTAGAYHIAEKDRTIAAGDNFPLRYGVEPNGDFTSNIWQDCRRGRDAWYSGDPAASTMDFASVSGADPIWKGMTHHSQFKCVQVVDDDTFRNLGPTGRAKSRYLQSVTSLGEPGGYAPGVIEDRDYLRATIDVCAASTVESLTPRGFGNPREPVLSCTATAAASPGKVVWAAVRIAESSRYFRGCMLQCAGSPYICPGSAPGAAPQPCFSLCGDTAASEWKTLDGGAGAPRVRGGVPVIPLADGVLGATDGLRIQSR